MRRMMRRTKQRMSRLPLVSRPPRRRKGQRHPRSVRGVALIFVLSTVAILTALAVEFSYNSAVDMKLAANSRDALRARSLANSAVNLSRLVLRFQRQIDAVPMGSLTGMLSGMQGGAGLDPALLQSLAAAGAAGAGGGAAASGGPSIRLWELLPIDSDAALMFLGGAFRGDDDDDDFFGRGDRDRVGGEGTGAEVQADFGEFTGSFSATITDEDQKINVQRLAYSLAGGPFATWVQLLAMMNDPKYDFIFDGGNRHSDRVERNDVILALKDWIDEDETGSTLDPSNITNPFAGGFGDENGPYSRYRPRYKAKNARFDTLDELYMVHGVGDAFMAAFGDRLTVYPDVNGKLNVNTNDPVQMLVNILTAAENPNDPAILDPLRLQMVMEQIQMVRMFNFIGLSVQQFVAILQANGIRVKPVITANSAQNVFLGDRSSTFRIVATGEVGDVKRTITAVVRYDEGLGQVLYWNEQ